MFSRAAVSAPRGARSMRYRVADCREFDVWRSRGVPVARTPPFSVDRLLVALPRSVVFGHFCGGVAGSQLDWQLG
jgi:hypothetical protein